MAVIDKDELQNLVDEGKSVSEIADMLNVNLRYIYRLIGKYGVEYKRSTKYSEKILRQIQDYYSQGLTIEEVAEKMHSTYDAIAWATRRYHIEKPEAKKKKPPKLMQIRSQYFTDKMSVADIAALWGTTEEEMLKYMESNNFFGKTTRKMMTHDTGSNIPDHFMDEWFKKCPVCGKTYSVTDCTSYAYKITHYGKKEGTKVIYFCSWTCIQKFRAEHPKKKSKEAEKYS